MPNKYLISISLIFSRHRSVTHSFLCLVIILLTSTSATGADEKAQQFTSESVQTHLLELFTSEGCNSCPPADKWVSRLKTQEALWKTVIPVVWHVDYWDYIGWRDQFAQPSHTARQYGYAERKQVSGVYTPGLMLDGKELRQWRKLNPAQLANSALLNKQTKTGTLTLTIGKNSNQLIFVPAEKEKIETGKAHVALLGMNIKSPIARGENRGRTLAHDFVVLDSATTDFVKSQQGYQATLPSLTPSKETPAYAIAAWITNGDNTVPIQAVGGLLVPN